MTFAARVFLVIVGCSTLGIMLGQIILLISGSVFLGISVTVFTSGLLALLIAPECLNRSDR